MNLSRFFKKNKIVRENTEYAATKTLTDEKGNPLMWKLKPLSTRENDNLRDECTKEVPVTGKPNVYRQKVDTSKYIAKMLVASVIEPDLYNAELQDSYGVRTPEDLIKEMIDDPGEYNDFATFIQEYNGFQQGIKEQVDEAKN